MLKAEWEKRRALVEEGLVRELRVDEAFFLVKSDGCPRDSEQLFHFFDCHGKYLLVLLDRATIQYQQGLQSIVLCKFFQKNNHKPALPL